MRSLIIGILIICVVGAIGFWAIDKFVNEFRLVGLLKSLIGLVCPRLFNGCCRWRESIGYSRPATRYQFAA